MGKTESTIALSELWAVLEMKFCIDLKNDFSNKDVQGWINHFAPRQKVNVYQHGKDATGKAGKGKTIKIFTGGIFPSLIRGCIPAKIMAKVIFKRLLEQDYSHSKIELLGIQISMDDIHKSKVHIKFERFNTSGKMYESAIGLYSLVEINKKWHISEMSIYDNNDELALSFDLREMWRPDK